MALKLTIFFRFEGLYFFGSLRHTICGNGCNVLKKLAKDQAVVVADDQLKVEEKY